MDELEKTRSLLNFGPTDVVFIDRETTREIEAARKQIRREGPPIPIKVGDTVWQLPIRWYDEDFEQPEPSVITKDGDLAHDEWIKLENDEFPYDPDDDYHFSLPSIWFCLTLESALEEIVLRATLDNEMHEAAVNRAVERILEFKTNPATEILEGK